MSLGCRHHIYVINPQTSQLSSRWAAEHMAIKEIQMTRIWLIQTHWLGNGIYR